VPRDRPAEECRSHALIIPWLILIERIRYDPVKDAARRPAIRALRLMKNVMIRAAGEASSRYSRLTAVRTTQ
jgi:hypothetical protein